MPRLTIEPPATVFCVARGRVAHVSPTCAGRQLTLELRRACVRRPLCRRGRRG